MSTARFKQKRWLWPAQDMRVNRSERFPGQEPQQFSTHQHLPVFHTGIVTEFHPDLNKHLAYACAGVST
jgi:hypothetical protein